MRALKCFFVMLAVAGLVACSDDSGTTPDGPVLSDGPLPADMGPGENIQTPDGPGVVDQGGPKAALESVVDKLTLPKNKSEFAMDLDSNGTMDNKFGEIFGVLTTAGMDLQTEIDAQITSGAVVILFEVFATSLSDDQAAKTQYHEGSKLPVANTYGITTASPKDAILDTKITGGKLAGGPGDYVIPVPMGATAIAVSLKKTNLTADVSSTGMTNGQLNGAIPWNDVDQKLIPAIATMVNDALNAASTPPLTKTAIKLAFDGNNDNAITADEVRNSALLGAILKTDVDLDGDNQVTGPNDGVSVGLGFTAASCTISK